jgi:hypothetical protein
MPRQFSLKTLLWLIVVGVAFFGGRESGIQNERDRLGAEVAAEKEGLRKQKDEWKKAMDKWTDSSEDFHAAREKLEKLWDELTAERAAEIERKRQGIIPLAAPGHWGTAPDSSPH